MVNPFLSEYHVWLTQRGQFAIVDTYYQMVLAIYPNSDEAYATLHVLRTQQRGTYPSIHESSKSSNTGSEISPIIEVD